MNFGEIEKQILAFGNITNCVVTAKKDSNDRNILCAYFTSDIKISKSNLKSFLRKSLPTYMIPVYLIQLDSFKYTPNGKLDQKALPLPKFMQNKRDIILPETETEKKISLIIEGILGISPISITDNFFDIGCDSLTALRIQIDLLNEGINVSYADIFKHSTIKELALKIDSETTDIDSIDDYDYAQLNELIKKNDYSSLDKIKYSDIGNVILTGATGFLGAHILNYLLTKTQKNVYCLVRKNSRSPIKTKLLSRLEYYFGDSLDNYLNNRFFVIESDITNSDLGLTKKDYNLLIQNGNCVINSAATVKHYGYYSDFEKINVTAVKNLIQFCLENNKKLIHISTTSVSGNTVIGENANQNIFGKDIIYTEKSLYKGQSLENLYVKSKFEAEKVILENILNNNLDGLILRVGNITPRFSDGKFQINSSENAFMNRIIAFNKLKTIPENILNIPLEFTYVDYLASAIVKSAENYNKSINILHLYNPNHLDVETVIKLLGTGIQPVPQSEFKKIVKKVLNNPAKKEIISFITNDMDKNYNLVYITDIKLKNDFTNKFLEKIGFKWPIPNESYIRKIKSLIKNK